MPRFPPVVLLSIFTAGLLMMGLAAFVLGFEEPAGWILFAFGTFDVLVSTILFVRSQDPPTT